MGCSLTIDALHFVYKNLAATDAAVESFRKFNPTSTYVVICDGGEDYGELCKKHNCEYIHSPIHLGYPQNPYGFRKPQLMEYLNRFHSAVSLCRGSHVMIMEDDVHIINDVVVSESDEMLVTENCLRNYFHPTILDFLMKISEDASIDRYYGMGGGSILHRESFLKAYERMLPIIDLNFDAMQSIYPTIGWTDCIISFIMMGIGKKHKVNPQLHELGVWGQDHSNRNYDGIEEMLRDKYSILHHYKKHYGLNR